MKSYTTLKGIKASFSLRGEQYSFPLSRRRREVPSHVRGASAMKQPGEDRLGLHRMSTTSWNSETRSRRLEFLEASRFSCLFMPLHIFFSLLGNRVECLGLNACLTFRILPPESEGFEVRFNRLSQEQAMEILCKSVKNFDKPAFSCALIAGDVVMLHLLHRLDLLRNSDVPVIFIDTLHLFPETYEFLDRVEERYDFAAQRFKPRSIQSKEELEQHYGRDLWKNDPETYDNLCKVEPFNRSLQELDVECLINGRRRDHGYERAHLEAFDAAQPNEPVKAQPLVYWEFQDCFDYLNKHGVEYHPLHDQGYPSIGAFLLSSLESTDASGLLHMHDAYEIMVCESLLTLSMVRGCAQHCQSGRKQVV